jgi:ATP-dependent exoDNAse (exonuclease V) alpha subunit
MNTDTIITFGKHRGTPITEVPASYLRWMLQTAASGDGKGPIAEMVREHGDAIAEAIEGEQRAAVKSAEFNYTLNPSQQEASNLLQEWLCDSYSPRQAKLEGGAGYGKSFTVLDVVRNAIEMGYTVAAAATSYVATQVLDQQLGGIGIPCRTLASSLKLTVEYDGPKALYTWDHGSSDDALAQLLGARRLLIVDEYSMVSSDIADKLLQGSDNGGGRLLCVGDLKQLPPVGESRPTRLASIETSATLTQPMRYSADSDLYALEQDVRENGFNAAIEASEHVSIHRSRESLLEAYVEAYRAHPEEDMRVLFFRRRDVVNANNAIRKQLFGSAAGAAVVEDEKLMVMATTDVRPLGQSESKRYYSGTSYRVVSENTIVVSGSDMDEMICHCVTLDNGDTLPIMFMETETKADPTKLGGKEYTGHLRRIAEQCDFSGSWSAYREFKNQFLPVGYNYAMTVHRCQGQTVDRVFFEAGSLRCGSMSNALLYVAATRAKREVHAVPCHQGG